METILRQFILVLVLSAAAFAGQSLNINTQSASNASVTRSSGLPWRVEFYVHDWNNTTIVSNSAFFDSDGLGYRALISNSGGGNVQLQVQEKFESGPNPFPLTDIQLGPSGNLPSVGIYLRCQHDPAGTIGPVKMDYCESWDVNGSKVSSTSATYSSAGTNGSGFTVGGGGNDGYVAFMRVCSDLVPLGSQMPTTAGPSGGSPCNTPIAEWKLDDSLNDSSGNGHTLTISSGSPAYVNTPNQNVISVLSTANATFWANILPQRAGQPAQLSGSQSFSQGDSGSNVTCFWQILSSTGSLPALFNRSTCTPTLSGLTFGDYLAQLTVTDSSGNTAQATAHIGAVATDSNGVVVQADPNADIIFGPMIAYGKNPWAYEDYMHNVGSTLLNYGTPASYWTWLTTGQGTVSYLLGGNGCGIGSGTGTTLHTSITGSSMSIVVDDASKLDLSDMPTRILLCNGALAQVEEVRISATTGNSGQQTLTVAYDGRASSETYNNGGNYYLQILPQSYGAGAIVGQYKIKGTSTKFITDPSRPMCPGGALGGSTMSPAGPVDYASGTVTMTPGSAIVSGSSTSWTSAMAQRQDHIRVQATHGGGTPFIFQANLFTFGNSTQVTLDRPYPADADAGTYAYAFITPSYILSTEYRRVDGSTGRFLSQTTGCESETSVYGAVAVDKGIQNGTSQTGQKYSWVAGLGVQSAFGPNFYGPGLAHRSLYLRSGLSYPLAQANTMDDYWVQDPQLDGGWSGGIPLLQGGAVNGAIADLVLNKSTVLTWPQVRQFVATGNANSNDTCNQIDTRDSGYFYSWLTLGYLFDPDSTSHALWKTGINNVYSRDTATNNPVTGYNGCKGADNSWANGAIFNTAGPAINVTHGSSIVAAHTGSMFCPNCGLGSLGSCGDKAHGTVTVTNGSSAVTGSSGFVNVCGGATPQIVLTGTLGGQPFVQFLSFQYSTSTSGTLAALWAGDSGTASFVQRCSAPGAAADFAAIGDATKGGGQDDPNLLKSWACVYNNSEQITLNTPWTGTSDSTGNLHWFSTYAQTGQSIAGYGQQPYMLGIRTQFMKWLGVAAPDSSIKTNFSTLAGLAGDWEYNTAFDGAHNGGSGFGYAFAYGMDYAGCTPSVTDAGLNFTYRNGGDCIQGLEPTSVLPNARGLTAEVNSGLRAYWDAHGGNSTALNFGDHAYGGLYGNPAYTAPGFYSDASWANATTTLTPQYLGAYKYFGFFFGMGMSHQWPAVRLGGVEAAQNRTILVSFDLASVPNATHVSVTTTEPSGAVISTTCSSSPCSVSGDARQGTDLVVVSYRSASDAVLAAGEPLIVVVQ